MVTKRLWWAAAAALIAFAGCNTPPTVDEDGGTPPADGGDTTPDGGEMCEDACTAAGTTCDGDALVVCAEDASGCLVETRTDCGGMAQVCDDSGETPVCADPPDPCADIPEADRCETADARACNEATLEVCTMNADGCLVLERTDCGATEGGVCDTSGAMPVCASPPDPCADVEDACATAGTTCDGTSLVTCAPNAFGCLVETRDDCASRAGGTCGGTPAACTFTGDPCDGVTQCAAAGTSCDGPDLVECAPDAFGCLVETRTTCTDAMFGFCDADGSPAACSTAATDPCMGETECGTEPSRTCNADGVTLETCTPNAFGCFVAGSTSCGDTSEVCSAADGPATCVDPCTLVHTCSGTTYCDGENLVTCAPDANGCLVESSRALCTDTSEVCSAAAGPAACVDPCSLVTICPSTNYCDGNDAVTCAPDANGCLVESAREVCTDTCDNLSATPACVTTSCSGAAPGFINCGSGTVSGDTAMGAAANPGNYPGDHEDCWGEGDRYEGNEQYWRFRNDDATRMAVTIEATRGSSSSDFDLFALDAGDGSASCTAGTLTCLQGSRGTGSTETVEFSIDAGADAYVVYDIWSSTTATTDYTLTVTCTPIVCGDGVINGDETCEDGNGAAGDGCDACHAEPGWECTGLPSTCTFVCGDGVVDASAGETCDDGRNDDGDGCSAVCAVEAGFSCYDEPSVCIPPAANSTCAGATAITGSTAFTAELAGGGAPPTGATCGGGSGDLALYYAVTVPAGQRVLMETDSSVDLLVFTLNACGDADCADSSDFPEEASFVNTGSSDITRIVGIRPWSDSVRNGTVDVTVTYRPLPTNSTCAAARAINADISIPGDDTTYGGAAPTGATCASSGAQTLYYAITVPAGQYADVDVDGASGFDAVVMELDSCGAADCSASTDATGSGSVETIRIDNIAGTGSVTRYIAVNEASASDTGAFDLEVSYAAPATNTTCGSATAISTDTTIGAQDTSFGGAAPTGATCGASGAQTLYYAITVGPRQIATVEVDGATGFDAVVMELDSCGATDCLDATDGAAGGGIETIEIDNGGGTSSITRIIAINEYSAGDAGAFDIDVSYITLAANAVCSGATSITTDTTLTGIHTSTGGAPPSDASCDDEGSPVLYYAVVIPAGSTATVTVTGASDLDPLVQVKDTCSASCSALVDDTGGGGVETVTLDNTTAAPMTQIVVVGDYWGDGGSFDLAVTYTP